MFGVNGIVNGLAVMVDQETNSQWDHITGEAFAGPLEGKRLDVWPISMSTNQVERERDSGLMVIRQSYKWTFKRFWQSVPWYHYDSNRMHFPPGFRRSFSSAVDERLPAFEQGLGIIEGNNARFYPFRVIPSSSVLHDQWLGKSLSIEKESGITPQAWWDEKDLIPMQLLTRWYGFSFTYPECSIYRKQE